MLLNYIKSTIAIGLALIFTASNIYAAPQTINMNIREKSVKDAIDSAIRLAVIRNVKEDRRYLLSLIETEALPISNLFVTSYKINKENPRPGSVAISASVDLEALRTLAAFNAISNEFSNKKALILVQTPDQGMPWQDKKRDEKDEALFSLIDRDVRARLRRRGFISVPAIEKYNDNLATLNASILSREFLAPAAHKLSVGLALSIKLSFVLERNSHGYNQRFLRLQAAIYNDSKGEMVEVPERKVIMNAGRRAYQRGQADELIQDTLNMLLFDLFSQAGETYVKYDDDRITVRLVNLRSLRGVNAIREAIEDIKSVNSVVEKKVNIAAYDFGVDTEISAQALQKKILALDTQSLGVQVKTVKIVDSKLLELEFSMVESQEETKIRQEARNPNAKQGSVY